MFSHVCNEKWLRRCNSENAIFNSIYKYKAYQLCEIEDELLSLSFKKCFLTLFKADLYLTRCFSHEIERHMLICLA